MHRERLPVGKEKSPSALGQELRRRDSCTDIMKETLIKLDEYRAIKFYNTILKSTAK